MLTTTALSNEDRKIEEEGRTLWQDAWRRLVHNPTAVISGLFIILLIAVAIFAPFIAPYTYYDQDINHARENPSERHPLGTDELGRDILSRIIYGARISLSVATVVITIETFLGVLLGMLAGYYQGTADMIIMRLTDIMFSFPSLLLAILIMGILGSNIFNIFFALSLVGWPGMARIVRGQVLSLKGQDFVEAARATGATDLKIMVSHILPNLLSPVIVTATMHVAGIILSEATLSFLGIGVQPPFPSWGIMVNELSPLLRSYPMLPLFPGIVLALTVLAFNFLGDGLRDALDPRLKG